MANAVEGRVPQMNERANNGLHQTGRGGVAHASRRGPVVEARPAGEPGCCAGVKARRLGRLPAAGLLLLATILQVACGEDEHTLRIENRTGHKVEGIVVAIRTVKANVPALGPGESVIVRLRINAESHWDVYLKDQGVAVGQCGYVARPSHHDLILLPVGSAVRDCEVTVA